MPRLFFICGKYPYEKSRKYCPFSLAEKERFEPGNFRRFTPQISELSCPSFDGKEKGQSIVCRF